MALTLADMLKAFEELPDPMRSRSLYIDRRNRVGYLVDDYKLFDHQIKPLMEYKPTTPWKINWDMGMSVLQIPVGLGITCGDVDHRWYKEYWRVRKLGKKKPRGRRNKIAIAYLKAHINPRQGFIA